MASGCRDKKRYCGYPQSIRLQEKEEVEWINDPKLSTTFFYKENINAFYISSNIKSDVVTAEIGVRVENTNIKTEVVSQSYTHLFPTLSLSWQTADYHALNLHYDRRIDRPNYRDLNPFVYVFDSYTYEQGNIDLKPQLTDRLNLSCTIRKAYKIALFIPVPNKQSSNHIPSSRVQNEQS